MTPEIAFVLILFALTLVLLAKEILPIEQVSLLLVVILAGSGVLSTDAAFQGFASETVVMLACVMVLSRRLADSGLIVRMTSQIGKRLHLGPRRTLAGLMGFSAALSSVLTNTSTTSVLIPFVVALSRRCGVSPGQFLMPVAYASMMGGSATLIGTSTNLAASGVLSRLGMAPFGVLEFVGVALVITLCGIALLTVFGPWLLPQRQAKTDTNSVSDRMFMTTLIVPEGSPVIGQPLKETGFAAHNLAALAISREGGRVTAHPNRKLHAADRIIVQGTRNAIIEAANHKIDGLVPGADTVVADPKAAIVTEAVLMPGARWIGQTVKSVRAAIEPGLHLLALHRRDQNAPALLGRMRLKTGDIMLMSGDRTQIDLLRTDPDLSLIAPPEPGPPTHREGTYTLAALVLAIGVGASGVLSFPVALLLAVLALVLTGRVTPEDISRMISWRILILIGGMSSFGVAMQSSGTASWLAGHMVSQLDGFGPLSLLLGLGVLTMALTQPMSNAAAALALLPVAIEIALQLGADPRPFVVMVTLSASLSFVTPLEPALLLVYGPGNYRFLDFIKAGLPLSVMSLCILLLLVPVLWPLGL